MAEESVESREERAKSSTSPEELEKLAEDVDVDVRYAVCFSEGLAWVAIES